jgi:hypothetical protein
MKDARMSGAPVRKSLFRNFKYVAPPVLCYRPDLLRLLQPRIAAVTPLSSKEWLD